MLSLLQQRGKTVLQAQNEPQPGTNPELCLDTEHDKVAIG